MPGIFNQARPPLACNANAMNAIVLIKTPNAPVAMVVVVVVVIPLVRSPLAPLQWHRHAQGRHPSYPCPQALRPLGALSLAKPVSPALFHPHSPFPQLASGFCFVRVRVHVRLVYPDGSGGSAPKPEPPARRQLVRRQGSPPSQLRLFEPGAPTFRPLFAGLKLLQSYFATWSMVTTPIQTGSRW